jgi:hypothetical protein
MTPYRIADLLPLAWRQVMVAGGPYTATSPGSSPQNAAGACPLGALAAAGLVEFDARRPTVPGIEDATAVLAAALERPAREVRAAIREFIEKWDAGEVADLAAALGLKGEDHAVQASRSPAARVAAGHGGRRSVPVH